MEKRTNKTFPERCEQVLQFIRENYRIHGRMPSLQEIAEGTGIKSRGGQIHPIINHLIETGDLEREHGASHRFRLPNTGLFSLPLKGTIAGDSFNPEMVLDDDPNAMIQILSELIPNKIALSKIYALKVRGDSMKEAMIADGDTVLMQEGDAWNEGDIVAVWLAKENATTLKKIHQGRPGVIKLKPRSHKHQTRVEKEEDIKILGRIVGVLRKYQ